MSNRKDATYDLIMLALGAVDELWSRVFDSVKAWAGEETSDRVSAAMVGWREAHAKLEDHSRALDQAIIHLADRTKKLEDYRTWVKTQIEEISEAIARLNKLVRALDQGMFQISDRVKILEERIAYVEEGDAGPRLSEADNE